mgnify:CR=1 FL=1
MAERFRPLGSRVRVSVTPCGVHGGRISLWADFSQGFSRFSSLRQISFHQFLNLHFPPLFIPFQFTRVCAGSTYLVNWRSSLALF